MTKSMCSQPFTNMLLINISIILSSYGKVTQQKNYVLVPFLVNQRLQLHEILTYLVSSPLLQIVQTLHRTHIVQTSIASLRQINRYVRHDWVGIHLHKCKKRIRRHHTQKSRMTALNRVQLRLKTTPVVVEKLKKLIRTNCISKNLHPIVAAFKYSSKLSNSDCSSSSIEKWYYKIVAWYVPVIVNPPNSSKVIGKKEVNPLSL